MTETQMIHSTAVTEGVTVKKTLTIMKNDSKLHKKSVIGPEKEQPMEILVLLTIH